jgi:hypothetical protein
MTQLQQIGTTSKLRGIDHPAFETPYSIAVMALISNEIERFGCEPEQPQSNVIRPVAPQRCGRRSRLYWD